MNTNTNTSAATDLATIYTAAKHAVSSAMQDEGKWQTLASAIRARFTSKEAFLELKADIITHGIAPSLSKDQRDALTRDLPRKGSKEHESFTAQYGVAMFEAASAKKILARATADSYFRRMVKYAFPAEQAEGEAKPAATLEARLVSDLGAWVKRLEKVEGVSFDVPAVLKHLKGAMALVAK